MRPGNNRRTALVRPDEASGAARFQRGAKVTWDQYLRSRDLLGPTPV